MGHTFSEGQWALQAYLIAPRSSSAIKAFEAVKTIQRSTTHVVHLMSDILHPRLTRLHAFNHQRKLSAYDRLRVKWLLEGDTLVGPPDAG